MMKLVQGLVAAALAAWANANPLDDYVWTPDSHYSWTDTGQTIQGAYV